MNLMCIFTIWQYTLKKKMSIVQAKLLIKKKIWANHIAKLKEPIYEFDVNIHFLPI